MISSLVLGLAAQAAFADPSRLTNEKCNQRSWDTGEARFVMIAGATPTGTLDAITDSQLTTTIGSTYTSATSLAITPFDVVAKATYRFAIKVGGEGSTVTEIKRGATAISDEGPLQAAPNCGFQKNKDAALDVTSTVSITAPTHGGDFDVWLGAANSGTGPFYTKKYSFTDSTVCASALATTGSDTITTTPANTAGAAAGSTATFTCPAGKIASGTAICSKGTWTAVTCNTAQQNAAASATGTSLVAAALVVAAVMAN